jgi:hypothetical protein
MIADKARATTEVVGKTEAEGNLPLGGRKDQYSLFSWIDWVSKAPAKFWKRSVSSRFTSKREARKAPERLAMRSQCFLDQPFEAVPEKEPQVIRG